MRRIVPLVVALLAAHFSAGSASAQRHFNGLGLHYPCAYARPPVAPDFQNTMPFYYNTCYGMTYGPNYCVYPGFPAFQGVLPVPCSPGGPQWSCGPSGMQEMQKEMLKKMGIAAFPSHLYARSPRDFFMVETDPRSQLFNYGMTNFYTSNSNTILPSAPYEP